MRYLGKETQVEVKTKSVRNVEYMRCDGCGKKILPSRSRTEANEYVVARMCRSSCSEPTYKDYCKDCAKFFVSMYIDKMSDTETIELWHRYLWDGETCDGYREYDDGYDLAEEDKNGM